MAVRVRRSNDLESGGVGVIPTDTGYAFCAREREGRGLGACWISKEPTLAKPLALLCRDLAAIDQYTRYQSRTIFKVLKKALLRVLHLRAARVRARVPRVLLKNGKRQWKRNTVGVRVPADAVCAAILEALDGEPLFCSSVPVSEDGDQLSLPRAPRRGWELVPRSWISWWTRAAAN